MTKTFGVFFACCVLLGILGGCTGGSSSDKSISFAARVQKAEKQNDPNLRARQFIRIAHDQVRAKDISGAANTLRLAGLACEKIPEPAVQSYVYALLIEADAVLDDISGARRDFEAASKVLETINDKDSKARAMARLGQSLGSIKDDAGQAAETIKKAETLAGELPDAFARGLTLITVAEASGKIGKTAEADRVIAQILKTTQSLPKGRSQVQLLAQTALLQHRLQQKEAAKKTFDLAVETAYKLENFHVKANALADIAVEVSNTGDAKRTHQLLDQAEKTTAKIPESDLQQQTLFHIHTLMGKLPRPKL
jgi:hypothetical protein